MPSYTIRNLDELQELANDILPIIQHHPVVAFYGKMGAGKTTFIKCICNALEITNTVTSPTFALVNEYHSDKGNVVYHFDFYRINKVEEIYDFGYEEYFYSGNYCFVEWPELAENVLLPDTLKITIEETAKGTRIITVSDEEYS